jgi:glycosyltransferase involved in cell wall biosynthesis
MRVAFVHNHYRTATPSGEDTAVELETQLLRDAGCEVFRYTRASDEIAGFSAGKKAALATRVVWSREDQSRLRAFLGETRPDVVHVHNTFPLISPAAVVTAAALGHPVVATLHNFRTLCVNAQLFRDGRPCERCVGHSPLPGLAHRCYRGSLPMSATIAASIALHRARGTWTRDVSRFIALSHFARERFVASGLPADRIDVLPNFVSRPRTQPECRDDYFLYLGRINFEKGLDFLASAWSSEFGQLLVVGDGPTRVSVERTLRRHDGVTFLGSQPHERAMEVLAKARALIVPSRVYEGSPVVLAEAYARGVPVIGPRHGAFAEYVEDGETGLLFDPGDPVHLAECMRALQTSDTGTRMGEAARHLFERTFTSERHRAQLLEVYRCVLSTANRFPQSRERSRLDMSAL